MGFHGFSWMVDFYMVDLLMGKSRILGISMGFVGIWDGFKGKSQGISLVGIWMQS